MQVLKSIGNRILWLLPKSEILDGYENPQLIDFIFQKTQAATPSPEPWLDLVDASAVLDFGGAFGRHYRDAVVAAPNVRWAVVETPAIVERAKQLETDTLRFFGSIDAAANWLGSISAVHSNGAIQYTPEPLSALRELCSLRAPKMIWDRVFLTAGDLYRTEQLSLLSENGPGFSFSRQRVRYTVTYMPETDFLLAHATYRLQERHGQRFVFVL